MDAVRIKQFAGNLKHAAFTGKGATIGGGKFSAAECKAAAIALDAAPAMLAALQLIVAERGHGGTLDGTPELAAAEAAIAAATGAPICDDPATAAAANLSRAGLIEAAGEALALAAPIVTIRADHLAALIGAAESYAEDLETGLADGTYDDRADLDAVQAAIAATGER